MWYNLSHLFLKERWRFKNSTCNLKTLKNLNTSFGWGESCVGGESCTSTYLLHGSNRSGLCSFVTKQSHQITFMLNHSVFAQPYIGCRAEARPFFFWRNQTGNPPAWTAEAFSISYC